MTPHEMVPVLQNEPISPRHFRLRLLTPAIAKLAAPGQFVHLRLPNTYQPLLRRPFSIEKTPDIASIDIIYDVVGQMTKRLSQLKPNDTVDLLGPLGKGFQINPTTKTACLIGGGVGIPPLLFLAQKLAECRINTHVFLGGKTKDFLLCEEAFETLGASIHIATDDGSRGYHGYIPELFEKTLFAESSLLAAIPHLQVFSCGPTIMMQRLSEMVRKHRLICQHSLEERMGCGVGVCIGCVARTTQGYQRTCREGPVFDDENLLWEKEQPA